MTKLKLDETNLAEKANTEVIGENEALDNEPILESVSDEANETIKDYEKEETEEKKNKNYRFWLILMGIVIVLLMVRLIIVPVAVVGESMMPTYKSGTLLVTTNASFKKDIKIGDIVVFRNEKTQGDMYIKRVEGIPGDVIQIKGGRVYRNGVMVEDSFDRMDEAGLYEEEMTLQDGQYFVLGDNRNHSTDSRFIGPVDFNDIMYVSIK